MDRQSSVGAQLVGGIFVAMLGVITVAGIYQVNKPNTPLVPGTVSVANNTLGAIFK